MARRDMNESQRAENFIKPDYERQHDDIHALPAGTKFLIELETPNPSSNKSPSSLKSTLPGEKTANFISTSRPPKCVQSSFECKFPFRPK
ncbi:hypothetical protein AVEN_4498-1 [Araneus ventricosus]|uniref:Uncharacterized protein n=1 Tax=Araneus ventricosus TaxID=182803 RepID=A0A4Y2BNL9_ARAVE|nr:hypothetical protein AVEN_4498-1 [Araneus ventricosus]